MAKETLEATKLLYDMMKHITTLSTASIVLMSTFLEKFFRSPAWQLLVPVTFSAFVISIVGCVVAMFGLAFSAETPDEIPAKLYSFFHWGLFAGTTCFLVGVISLVVFSVKNF